MSADKQFDVAVIGAGVFGAWAAFKLRRAGADVVLIDSYGSGNSRSSSGGESRIIRMGYGADEIYTRMAQRSIGQWRALFDDAGQAQLFQSTGVLWLARENDLYCEATLKTLQQTNVRFERLEREELGRRYPQLDPDPASWGILEPDSGVLMARQAVQAVVRQTLASGATYLEEAIVPPDVNNGQENRVGGRRLSSLLTNSGRRIAAREFVFACGPWLPKIFPALLAELIHVTRQEVFFFGIPAGGTHSFASERMPAWIDFTDLVYGIPNLDQRGFKIAIDEHGPVFDPDTSDRVISQGGLAVTRAYLARRMPALRNAPVTETRVCQYENTSNGDFLIDVHPAFSNVWLVGGGSGHGFKHGPAVGEHVAALISGEDQVEPRFALVSKESLHNRKVY